MFKHYKIPAEDNFIDKPLTMNDYRNSYEYNGYAVKTFRNPAAAKDNDPHAKYPDVYRQYGQYPTHETIMNEKRAIKQRLDEIAKNEAGDATVEQVHAPFKQPEGPKTPIAGTFPDAPKPKKPTDGDGH
jgi:hypothetical protein